ncbi:MAG: DNA repair protein RecN [Bacteroidales bacterium]|nr:DNA repair protein RecN [Bacteroidales bacterium]
MLRSLHIRNYVLIDSLDIDFPEGLVIITGQTGAGKSIIVGALSLLTGAKADASAISQGADSLVVEAEFDASPMLDSIKGLSDDVEWDDGRLLIRRTVHSSGRSRSFINDCPVNLQILSQLSSRLVDIHSQHQGLLLRDKLWQLSLLDHFASNGELLHHCSQLWRDLGAARRELEQLQKNISDFEADRQYNEARFQKLEAARLRQGELEELEAEHKVLAGADSIRRHLYEALSACDNDNFSVTSSLKDAGRNLEKAAAYLPQLQDLASRLQSAGIEIDDILSGIDDAIRSVDAPEGRLEAVEERMSELYGLLKNFGCPDIAALIAKRDSLASLLEGSMDADGRKEELEAKIASLEKDYSSVCTRLSASRRKAAGPLSKRLQEDIRSLELDKAVFEISVSESDDSFLGRDRVDFLFTASGTRPESVEKCASGGEMSRIMLCLKALMAKYEGMPTLIFDEIDTGVSGSVAAAMGRMICSMGADMQVFAITHLPQVAARGEAHFVVSRHQDGSGRDCSTILRVEGEDRVKEIARLLSGATVTPAALANARVLLSEE